MKHKLLSILLCLAMALSLLPTAALAEGETGAGPIKVGETSYSSFSDAVNAAEPDGSGVITYEISGKVDVTATGWVQVAKAGLTGPTKVEFVGKTGDAEICITGGLAILADQKYDIDVSFTNLKLSKPNPTYGGDYGHSTNYFTCWLRNTGAAENTVTYTNCTFPNGVCNNQYGKTVFNNCKFTNNTAGLSNLWNYGGETKVEECTFTGTRGIKMYNEGTLQNPPSIEIKNTNFTGMTEKAAIVVSKAANVTLNTVGATDCTMGLLQKDIEGSTDEQKVTIEANGTGISGDFNITAQKDAEAAKNEFNITAGTFAGEINNDYLAPGANFDATTGEVKMSYVAKIGDTEYPTLTAAINEANTGDTVKLVNNVTVTKPIEVTKSMTLDLNGHVLTAATASTATVKNSAIWVTAEKVNLTIDGTTAGSGMTMGDTHDTNWEAKVWGFVDLREGSAGSTVTVNGGSYTGSTCASDSYHYTALFTVGSESKLVLNNVSAETDERVVKASSCGEVVVSGGTYNITGINAFLGAAFETKTASFTDMKLTAKYGGCVQVGRNATLENCEIKVTDIRTGDGTYLNCAVAVQYGGTATVKSGIYTAPYAAYVYSSGGTINIENGTFTGVVRADATTDTTAVINIKNGSFNGEIQKGGGPGSETISITGGTFSFDPSTKVKNNGTDYIVKRAGSEGAYTYTVLAKSGLTSGVYLTDPSGALASNYYVSSTANGVWTVSYSAPSSGGGSSSSSRRYDVSAPSVKHGDVTVSPKSASKGDTVTITVKPDSGYELDTLTVKDASGSKIKVKDKGDGKFTFTMPASKVTVSAEFAEIETLDFADVPTDAYYYEAVKWAAKKGITGGIGNGLFGPNQPCTRAQIVTFLWRAAGSPEPKTMSSFADVSMDAYYAKAVAWAVENGITTGTGDGKFSPDATCTRAQSVTFLFRAIGKLVDSKAEFSDVLADSYYANAVDWAVENGVTNGIGDGLFGPDNSCTRAQIVTFLYRAYQGK